ncbi:MAG TPA: hypothetical protein PLM71_01955 [Syntrophorhabdaceae bacterium]|nr:hypothetical protein [Syntrophorhabdaceae bacterium]
MKIHIKTIKFFINPLCLFLFLLFSICPQSKGEETCVMCHGDENIIKALYKPAKIDFSEGEG